MTGQARQEREWVLEAMTMALYISLSLLAVLVAIPGHDDASGTRAAVTVSGAAVGLVLAHFVAFRLSSRLVDDGLLTPESLRTLGAQLSGAVPVAVAAAAPPLLLGGETGALVSEIVLLAFVSLVGYRAARQSRSPGRSVLYVGVLVLAVGLIVAVKGVAGH